jgi:hypothetical protein
MEHAKWLVDGSVPGKSPSPCIAKGTAATPEDGATAAIDGTGCVIGTVAIIEGQSIQYNAFGYPTSLGTVNSMDGVSLDATSGLATTLDAGVCVKIWEAVLSSGRPTISISPTDGGSEWGAAGASGICTFTYYGGATTATLRNFTYDTANGGVVLLNK